MKRRTFLGAGAAIPGIAVALTQLSAASARHSSFDPWVEIHAGHLRRNAAAVHRLTRVPIIAVIKNNGYGGGVTQVAQALRGEPSIRSFAVVKQHEAMTLRDAGIRKPVLQLQLPQRKVRVSPMPDSRISAGARSGPSFPQAIHTQRSQNLPRGRQVRQPPLQPSRRRCAQPSGGARNSACRRTSLRSKNSYAK